MLHIDNRDQVQLQTISNLVTAGALKPDEAESYNNLLSEMSLSAVLAALVESWRLREQCHNPANYYPIGDICLN